jgi:xanthine dehydrogenase molybdenum-binding subunit
MNEEFLVVGKRLPRVDAREKATGTAKFTVDIKLHEMLYAKILRSPHAHARIVQIDTSKAEKLPGVKAVLTHKEARIPFLEWLGMPTDEYVLDDSVRYVGDKVAAVAAVSEEVAEEALKLLNVEYEVLPAVFDQEEAMKPGAPKIHPEIPEAENNVSFPNQPILIEVGDIEKGFKEADYIFENTYKTSRQCHCSLEPHVCVASWDNSGKLTFWSSEQTAFFVRERLANALGIPLNKVRVIVPHVGGGFGSKYGYAEEVICALLAKKTCRPVKLECTREEEFATTRTRHPWSIKIKTGVKKDGTFTARYMRAVINTGAYGWHGAGTLMWGGSWFVSLYRCPNIRFEGYPVYTNSPVAGAFRGYGNPQANFAMECQIDEIAERLGMDPLELRLKNHIRTGDVNPANQFTVTSCGLDECMRKGAERIGWNRRQKKPRAVGGIKKRGIGMACMIHGMSSKSLGEDGDIGSAIVKINTDGTAHLLLGIPDIGQGSNTVLAQIAAEELGVRLEDISVTTADTDTTTWNWIALGSRTTVIVGNAVKAAMADAKMQLFEKAAEILQTNVENLVAKDRKIYIRGAPDKGRSIAEVALAVKNVFPFKVVVGRASYEPPTHLPPFAAQFAEVEVDTETGKVDVLKIVAAHDVGKAINPDAVEGQIEGGLQQSIGYTFTEDMVLDEVTGKPLNPGFRDYKILKAVDMPDIDIILVEPVDPEGPFGAKGVGEVSHVPTAAAIANAIYNATGVRIKELPITPEKILKGLREK